VKRWKCRAVENLENRAAVSHLSHRAWKSLTRFPHSHRPTAIHHYPATNGARPGGRLPDEHNKPSLCYGRSGGINVFVLLSLRWPVLQ
jgi:hypothetical protein